MTQINAPTATCRKSPSIHFLLLALIPALAFGAPFAEKIPFTQPDGSQIEVWGKGDEFYAVFESLDGYSVVFNHATKASMPHRRKRCQRRFHPRRS